MTICGRFAFGNQTQFEYGAVLDDLVMYGIDPIKQDYLDLFEVTSEMCFEKMGTSLKKNISKSFENSESKGLKDVIEQVFRANVSDFVTKCRGIESTGRWPCKRGFVKILTRNGLCLSFNMLRRKELVKENVYEKCLINNRSFY